MRAARKSKSTRNGPLCSAATALCCFIVLGLLALLAERAAGQQSSPGPKRVVVTIDYGDGVEKRFKEIPWRDGMNILDAMKFAQKHPRGIKYQMSGRGKTAFLSAIDDLKNQGSRGSGANWIYRVNNKLGDRSFAIYRLNPGDAVLWRFGPYAPR